MADVGEHYRRTRVRLCGLLGDLDAAGWATPVPACPDWTVHDILGHLVGVAEDVLDGRLTGPPEDDQTAAQVSRHRGDPPDQLIERWSEIADPLEQLIGEARAWPAAMDAGSHEQDVRGALGRSGARDDALILEGARRLVRFIDVDANLTVDLGLGDEPVRSRARPAPAPEYRLRTTPFEVFRFRLGRRTPGQVASLDWSPSPPPDELLRQLFIFGPARSPLVE